MSPYATSHMAVEQFQGWRLHHLPEQLILVSDHVFHQEIFPNIWLNTTQPLLERLMCPKYACGMMPKEPGKVKAGSCVPSVLSLGMGISRGGNKTGWGGHRSSCEDRPVWVLNNKTKSFDRNFEGQHGQEGTFCFLAQGKSNAVLNPRACSPRVL